ncbi:histone deacetylase family protein [Marinomonas balearica]|nr:histone deacetylase [Marinomonas balearica]
MSKFRLLAEHLSKLGLLTSENCHEPSPLSLATLMRAHDKQYVQRFVRGQLTPKEEREIGLPWSEWLVERTLRAVSGTILTAELALETKLACHLAGGTHHAHPTHGAGFCIFNDLAVASKDLIYRGLAEKVMILDCDVHQGDGTAAFFANEDRIIPVSWHCYENYPIDKNPNGVNVAIPKRADGALYLSVLRETLPRLLLKHQPDFIFYDAGIDVHVDDRLGFLTLTDDDIRERDRYVIETCLDLGLPVACVIGGGYDRQEWKVAQRHSLLHQVASEIWYERGLSSMPSMSSSFPSNH